jgi:glycerol 3-phosphatase-2
VKRVSTAEPDRGSALSASKKPLIDNFDGMLLDLDGVVYIGVDPVPEAVAALSEAAHQGLFLGYITNNAARSAEDVALHLQSLGLSCLPDQVVTSAQVAAAWLADRFDAGSPILVIGGSGLHQAVLAAGLRAVTEVVDAPVAVVQGFGPDVGWRQLAQASLALTTGVPWVATNLDLTVPTPAGVALGNGALVQALTAATGRRPDCVTGKPEPSVFAAAVRRWELARPLVVGDRLDTDIAGARAAGLPALLVLTGVSGVADVLGARQGERPDFLGRDLTALYEAHPVAVGNEGALTVGGWSATLEEEHLVVHGAGDPVDALRAAAAMAWQASAEGRAIQLPPVIDRLESLLRYGG